MIVTRRALLISNPGETGAENYCKGVFVDVKKYQTLLCAAHGGAWRTDEIVQLNRPSKTELRKAVTDLAAYTYSFISFSGHGWYSSVDMCNVLTLRKGEEIASSELLSGATRRTVILDCCRKVYHEPVEKVAHRANAMTAEEVFRQADPRKCRELFSTLISRSTTGVVEIKSCDIGETAGDDEVEGGRYSSSLFACASAWAGAEKRKPLWTLESSASVIVMHDQATHLTKRRSGDSQNAKISKPRSGDYYPFTVFAS